MALEQGVRANRLTRRQRSERRQQEQLELARTGAQGILGNVQGCIRLPGQGTSHTLSPQSLIGVLRRRVSQSRSA